MPTYNTSQEWLEQSSLLLKARPSTTRITTAYSIKTAQSSVAKTSGGAGVDAAMPDAPALKPPRGRLVLKTFDPVHRAAQTWF
ncbi:hypothetical protein BN1723_001990 [Verticillium longisporum]|uniref:SRP9 domain-containing protein n=1 Tax=Verticillium longisporum TaxID=100787 RepID=A0A0G4KWB4_VERLO|nr:hypothetical protein BN1723_001990 [Verticillium longisporum]